MVELLAYLALVQDVALFPQLGELGAGRLHLGEHLLEALVVGALGAGGPELGHHRARVLLPTVLALDATIVLVAAVLVAVGLRRGVTRA
ncbi:hypothetical protein GCM10023080_013090 [Streptomyces pseudoechinosporeus]